MTQPTLNLEDLRSPTWRKVKAWAEAELAQLIVNLEADQTPERTAKLRGQIKSHRTLINLEVQPSPVPEDD
jgi:hypothetical protein